MAIVDKSSRKVNSVRTVDQDKNEENTTQTSQIVYIQIISFCYFHGM